MSRALARQRLDMALFLGPACLLLAFFFLAPVVVDVFIAFTDMGRNLTVTRFTTENFERMLSGDRRLPFACQYGIALGEKLRYK